MSFKVISRLECLNISIRPIELTEKQKSVIIGSDDSCRKGCICQNELILAPYHCYIYITKDENRNNRNKPIWKTFIQEKATSPQKYVTFVNDHKLEMRKKQLLFDKDDIKIGSGDQLIMIIFHDEYARELREEMIRVPEPLRNRFKNEYDEIGKGASSAIYRSKQLKPDGSFNPCVCKIVSPTTSKNLTKYSFNKLCQEPRLLKTLSHSNIIKILEYHIVNPDRLFIWLELMNGENLDKYLDKVKFVNQNEWYNISYQIVDALQYLHDNNIIHRDLKPANIMWVDNRHSILKLIDFGFAKNFNESSDRDLTVCGTPLYTPPELHAASAFNIDKIHDLYKPSVDIWAFGILSFLFLTGFPPYLNDEGIYDGDTLVENIIKKIVPKEPLLKKNVDERVAKLITDEILTHDYKRRITANGIINFFITKLE